MPVLCAPVTPEVAYPGGEIVAAPRVDLPYAAAGDGEPVTTSSLTCPRGCASVHATVSDPRFTVSVEPDPVRPGSDRPWQLRFAGDEAVRAVVTLTGLSSDGVESDTEVVVTATVGAPLPEATWVDDGWGSHTFVTLPSAPFPHPSRPFTDATVFVAVPSGLDPARPIDVVVHVHGHDSVLRQTVTAQRLAEQLWRSGRQAMLIVPQGPVAAPDGCFGKLEEPGGAARLIADARDVAWRDGRLPNPELGAVVLSAHSGGYRGTAAMVQRGGVPVAGVLLFDALYDRESVFAAFAAQGGVLRTMYTDGGGTADEHRALRAMLAASNLPVSEDESGPITVRRTEAWHGACVDADDAYARWLASAPLAPRDG